MIEIHFYQFSLFDKEPLNKEVKETVNCYHCVFYESNRCRNERECPSGLSYKEYIGSTVRQCFGATVEVFQDGYMHCPILECTGCEKCMEDFNNGSDFIKEETQNYKKEPRWKRGD